MPKLTIYEWPKAQKKGRKVVEIRASNAREAVARAEVGVETLVCMKEDLPVIRPAIPEEPSKISSPMMNGKVFYRGFPAGPRDL